MSNRLTDVAQLIGQFLEAAGVLCDVHTTLDEVAEFSFQVHSMMQLIVAELLADLGPDDVRRWLGSASDGEQILRDGVVQPVDNALVDHAPVRVAAFSGGWWSSEVGVEPKLADEGIEEAPPLIVVGISELKDDRDV